MEVLCQRCKSRNLQYIRGSTIKCDHIRIVCMDCGFEF